MALGFGPISDQPISSLEDSAAGEDLFLDVRRTLRGGTVPPPSVMKGGVIRREGVPPNIYLAPLFLDTRRFVRSDLQKIPPSILRGHTIRHEGVSENIYPEPLFLDVRRFVRQDVSAFPIDELRGRTIRRGGVSENIFATGMFMDVRRF